MKEVSILGATGSIGLNTLEVISRHTDKYKVFALSANKSWQKMLLHRLGCLFCQEAPHVQEEFFRYPLCLLYA
jgi:1-deoxy-D-xylulose 5-phosphate reductoisomerase